MSNSLVIKGVRVSRVLNSAGQDLPVARGTGILFIVFFAAIIRISVTVG